MLDELPEHHREILVLRLALGLSAVETAQTVGSTSGAVRVTQHRALTRLRELVAARRAEPQERADAPPSRTRTVQVPSTSARRLRRYARSGSLPTSSSASR